jgi:hypothetical protein
MDNTQNGEWQNALAREAEIKEAWQIEQGVPVTRLTVDDCELIITSLDFTVRAFQEYNDYPSYEFKVKRVSEAEAVRQKVRDLRKALKAAK